MPALRKSRSVPNWHPAPAKADVPQEEAGGEETEVFRHQDAGRVPQPLPHASMILRILMRRRSGLMGRANSGYNGGTRSKSRGVGGRWPWSQKVAAKKIGYRWLSPDNTKMNVKKIEQSISFLCDVPI
jgi:hypothetical protein